MKPDLNKINEITSRYILPTIEERTSYGYKRLDPYTKLFEERIIFLGQGIDDTVANDVMAQLLTLESMDPDRDIDRLALHDRESARCRRCCGSRWISGRPRPLNAVSCLGWRWPRLPCRHRRIGSRRLSQPGMARAGG